MNIQVATNYLKQDHALQKPHIYLSQVASLTEGERIVEVILADPKEFTLLQIEPSE